MSPRQPSQDERVDPRIEQRRRQVSAARRRRRQRRVAAALVLVALAAGAWALTRSSLLEVTELEVGGADRTGAEAVLAASGIETGDPLVDVDLGAARRSVEALPWVAEAEVNRRWTARSVIIEVRERSAAAAVATEQDAAVLVDRAGRLLEAVPNAGDLPLITGVPAGAPGEQLDEAGDDVLQVAAELTEGVRTRVSQVRPAEGAGVELVLAPRGRVVVGAAEELDAKVRTLQTMFAAADLSCLATIDVRVADTAVLTREEPCE